MKKLIFLLVPSILMAAVGGTAGFMLHTPPPPEEPPPAYEDAPEGVVDDGTSDFARLNNQFIIPVIRDERVAALAVVSLTVEVTEGQINRVFEREPRLRDLFLRVMYEHANFGGFDGNFTSSSKLDPLRDLLTAAARQELSEEEVLRVIIDKIDVQQHS
ncbi:MAG: flagellar basal body-associated protein FliL [Pseudomonadota bacterium]